MYSVGKVLERDDDFYGRARILDELYAGPERRIFLLGLRRTGKSSVLLALERRALEDEGVVPVRVALEGSSHLDDIRDDFANALSRRRRQHLPDLPGGFLKLRALSLSVLLRVAEEAAEEAGRRLLFLVDEVDAIARLSAEDPELHARIRGALPTAPQTRFVFTGSRRAWLLKHESPGRAEPLLSDFVRRTLPPGLDPTAARALVGLSRRGGVGAVGFDEAQTDWLVGQTGGHPFLIQAACQYALRFGGGPERALEAVLSGHEAQDAFRQDLERTSPSERQVIEQIRSGRTLDPRLEPYLRALVDVGLVTRARALTVPVMSSYLDRTGWRAMEVRFEDSQSAPAAAAPASPAPPADGATSPSLRVVRVLGEGTFGSVLLLEMVSEGDVRRRVAFKQLRPRWLDRPDVAARLRDEARMLARLHHRAIVRAEGLLTLDGRVGIVMEYVPGIDLHHLCAAVRDGTTVGLSPRALAELGAEVAEALHVAWDRTPEGEPEPFRVLHRDIKPHNIRLTPDGDVKVLDFGVAGADFAYREHESLMAGGGGGTPRYMAPERHRGIHDLPASDIFALGVTLVELCTGRPGGPWPADEAAFAATRAAWAPEEHLPPALVPIIHAMTDGDPTHRPTAEEVVFTLRDLVLEGDGLRSWARYHVPNLLDAPAPPEPDTLVHSASVLETFHGSRSAP